MKYNKVGAFVLNVVYRRDE